MNNLPLSALRLLLLVLPLALFGAGCGDMEEPGDDDDVVVDDDDAGDEICTDEDTPDIGEAADMTDNIHDDGWFFVYLDSMTTDHEGTGSYDWMAQMSATCPTMSLGDGATVANLGPVGFHDLELAPTEDYVQDGTFDTDWQDGGSGHDGFDMSGNIYVIRTADDRFGKVEILSAREGVFTWRAYLQEDPGSCNIRTSQ